MPGGLRVQEHSQHRKVKRAILGDRRVSDPDDGTILNTRSQTAPGPITHTLQLLLSSSSQPGLAFPKWGIETLIPDPSYFFPLLHVKCRDIQSTNPTEFFPKAHYLHLKLIAAHPIPSSYHEPKVFPLAAMSSVIYLEPLGNSLQGVRTGP